MRSSSRSSSRRSSRRSSSIVVVAGVAGVAVAVAAVVVVVGGSYTCFILEGRGEFFDRVGGMGGGLGGLGHCDFCLFFGPNRTDSFFTSTSACFFTSAAEVAKKLDVPNVEFIFILHKNGFTYSDLNLYYNMLFF